MATSTSDEEFFSNFPVDITNWIPPISPGFPWVWEWTEEDDNENPRNTTGWTAEMDIRATANGDLIKKLSTANGGIVNDNNGKFTVTLAGADSLGIGVRQVVSDVKVTDNSGNTNNEFKMTIPVEEIVTR